jgi:hypothetical protein
MSLYGSISLNANFTESSSLDLRTAQSQSRVQKILSLLDGSGASQVNKIFTPATAPAVAQSTNTDYDLSGSLAGAFGSVVFTAVKALIVVADASNLGAITLFGGTNPFLGPLAGTTPTVSLLAGEMFCATRRDATGWAVANGSTDNFRIATAATTGTYSWDLLIVGIG